MSGRMRILHVIQNLNYGGMERLIVGIAGRADPRRFESHVMVLQYFGRYADDLRDLATLHLAPPMSRWSMLRPSGLARQIARIAPDVVHTHSGVWYKASLAARMAGVERVIHTEHGRHCPDPLQARLIDGLAARRTDIVVAVSDALEAQLAGAIVRDRDRIRVVPNGVDSQAFRPRFDTGVLRRELGLSADVPIIGSIGRLEPVKGYEVMIEAFARLRARCADEQGDEGEREHQGGSHRRPPVLVLAGNGAERGRLEALARSAGIASAVHFLGWRDDVHDLHSAFSLFTMSSRSEGTSVSLLEAMSAGLCPVVTDVGGNRAVLGEDLRHRLVPPEQPQALAAAWLDALSAPDRRRDDAAMARARVIETFSLDAMVRAYETLYGRHVARRVGPHTRSVFRAKRVPARHSGPSPFFEAPGGARSSRRLLLISLVFPPGPGVGALRWQKMARHVHERGWELDVITMDPDSLETPDWSRLTDLPPGTRLFGVRPPVVPLGRAIETAWAVLRTPRRLWRRRHPTAGDPGVAAENDGTAAAHEAPRATSLARDEIRWVSADPRTWIRAYNAWHAYAELKRSARDICALGEALVRARDHDAVISSGPPHAAHEGARRVARRTGIPFVMDMRDPWSLFQRCPEDIASPLLMRLGQRYERRAIEQAALVVANTEAARSALTREYPAASARTITVMNGFDDEPRPRTRHGSVFIIAYAGTIYLDRDPSCLLRAARRVIRELGLSPDQLAIEFLGVNDGGISLTAMAEREGIGAHVRVGGLRPRLEALELLARANMLVILPQDSYTAIPAKVFEYMRFDAWLLALAERDSATEQVLRDTDADVVSPGDIDAIAATIAERYRQHASGMTPRAIANDARLSRRAQADVLLEALEGIVGRGPSEEVSAAPGVLLQEAAS